MREFIKGDECCKILIGPSGCGKSKFCELLFKEANYNVIRPAYDTFLSHKDFVQFIEISAKTTTILDIVQKKKKILFLDDVDVLLSQDRYAATYLTSLIQKIQSKQYNIKLVITCVAAEEKKLTDIKKKVDHLKLHVPTLGDCLLYIMGILDAEGYEVEEESLVELIKTMQFNIRNILVNIFTCSDMENEANQRAYYDMNIFEVVGQVFNNSKKGFDDLDIALSSDPTLISYMMYDNFKEYIRSCYTFTDDHYTTCIMNVMKFYMDSSIIEAEAYVTNEWENIETANLIKCGSIRAFQNSIAKKPLGSKQPYKICYTTIMTRSSQHYCNMKKVERFAARNEIDFHNMALLSEIAFENCKEKTWKNISKDDDGTIITSYMSNVCTKEGKVHGRRVRRACQKTLTN
jgi:SpoVK/Ycf46/Vps4 family AAA+-type ATPase